MKHKITAPNPKYSGVTGDCQFTNGVGYTDNKALLAYFESAGYKVESEKTQKPKKEGEPEKEGESEKTEKVE